MLAQDCNLVLYDGNAASKGGSAATAVYYSATYGDGANPCSLVVSSAAGGYFAVVDAKGTVVFQRPTPPPQSSSVPPPTTLTPPPSTASPVRNNTLLAGQTLGQVSPGLPARQL